MGPEPAVAYIAEGKLYLKGAGGEPRLIDSPFVQGILDRVSRDRQRNEWKAQGGIGWNFGARSMMPMPGQPPAEVRRVQYTGVGRGAGAGELVYAIDTDHVGGLFAFQTADNSERRLFHRNQFRPRDLVRHPIDGTLAFSLAEPDGSANIAILTPDGRGLRELTEGDSVDEAPSWSGSDRVLLFQSAGIGRDAMGLHRMHGPYAIQRLDLDRGDLTTLAEDGAYDFLSPRLGPDGALYYIRRPYQPHGHGMSPLKALLDVLLFPYRVARAIVHFLNFFSLMFARKPLLTAGGPPREGPDARYLMLWGKVIDAEKAMKASKKLGGTSLVPSSWELIRSRDGSGQEVLAKGVLSYDLCGDGVVYSNGSTVTHRFGSGDVSQLATGRMIERVVSVG